MMSIIMLDSRTSAQADSDHDDADQLDRSLRELLDHIAVELAQEYVLLMEAASEAESGND